VYIEVTRPKAYKFSPWNVLPAYPGSSYPVTIFEIGTR
jgi:hypothetical protein